MSPSKEKGYNVGDKFRSNYQQGSWPEGQIVILETDDGSTCPLFRKDGTDRTRYIHIDHVEKIEEATPMTQVSMQQLAIQTFTTMVERATAYRENPGANDKDLFQPRYGICDNVSLSMPSDLRRRYHDAMMCVKDNLIRQVPSFSGAYHYPVPAPGVDRTDERKMEREAENAYDNNSDKWAGDYGAERLIQAKEVLDWVTNKWDDRFATNMTPAQRNGIVPMETIVVEKTTGQFYVLQSDDESNDPYFIPYGETGRENRRCIRLQDIRVVRPEDMAKRPAGSLISEINRRRAARLKLEDKVKALQAQIDEMVKGSVPLEMALLVQHGVRVVKR